MPLANTGNVPGSIAAAHQRAVYFATRLRLTIKIARRCFRVDRAGATGTEIDLRLRERNHAEKQSKDAE